MDNNKNSNIPKYYEILNISQGANINEINKAYKILMLQYHPDKPTGNRELFDLVFEAHKILSNEKTKQEYDEYLNNCNDHLSLKSNYNDHLNLIKQQQNINSVNTDNSIEPAKNNAKNNIDNMHKYFNTKHNINGDSHEDVNKIIHDIKKIRSDEYSQYKQEKKDIKQNEFNNYFNNNITALEKYDNNNSIMPFDDDNNMLANCDISKSDYVYNNIYYEDNNNNIEKLFEINNINTKAKNEYENLNIKEAQELEIKKRKDLEYDIKTNNKSFFQKNDMFDKNNKI